MGLKRLPHRPLCGPLLSKFSASEKTFPLRIRRAALTMSCGEILFSVPISSSAPQRPQFFRRSEVFWISWSVTLSFVVVIGLNPLGEIFRSSSWNESESISTFQSVRGGRLGCGCRCRLLCGSCRNRHNADQHEQSAQKGPRTQRLTRREISDKDGDDRIHVCVRSDLGYRFVVNQPNIGRKPDDRAEDNQIQQREPSSARNGGWMEPAKFSERPSRHRQQDSPGKHLRARAHRFGRR